MTIDLDLKFDVYIEDHISQSESIDLESLFHVVREVLEFATIIALNHLEGEREELPKQSIPPINFNSPMHIIKKILCKVSCSHGNDGNPRNQVQASILDDVLPKSKYSAAARTLLTLAAFALQYGEFWFYFESWNDLSIAIGALRRVEDLKGHLLVGENQKELIQLNDFLKETWEFIYEIIKVEKILTSENDTRNLKYREDARSILQDCSKIAIQTIVDCMVHFDALTNHRTAKPDFSLSTSELRKLHEQLKQIETKNTNLHLVRHTSILFQSLKGLMESKRLSRVLHILIAVNICSLIVVAMKWFPLKKWCWIKGNDCCMSKKIQQALQKIQQFSAVIFCAARKSNSQQPNNYRLYMCRNSISSIQDPTARIVARKFSSRVCLVKLTKSCEIIACNCATN